MTVILAGVDSAVLANSPSSLCTSQKYSPASSLLVWSSVSALETVLVVATCNVHGYIHDYSNTGTPIIYPNPIVIVFVV